MTLVQRLTWVVEGKKPPKWGRETTKEELEEIKKEKHTPGKKKKKGRSQIKHEPGRYAGRSKPKTGQEKGKRCGKSYIAKEDECSIGKPDPLKKGDPQKDKAPKKPRTPTVKPKRVAPDLALQPPTPELREQQEVRPKMLVSPEGGKGMLIGDAYLHTQEDGMYDMQESQAPHRVYFPRAVDQAQAQYVSSAIADLMGLASPEDYLFRDPGSNRVAVGHPVPMFTEMDELQLKQLAQRDPDVAGYFVHSVLVRHDGVVGENFDNMVLRKDNRVTVLHLGGTLLWDILGKRRNDGMSPEQLPELQTLRSQETNWQASVVFGTLSDEQISQAIATYLVPVEDSDILDLVDAAKFSPEDRAEIGKGLIARKQLLEAMTRVSHEQV